MLLLGTTDEAFDGDPSTVAATAADEAQILEEAATSLEADVIEPGRVRASFAGLRVLPLGKGGTACDEARDGGDGGPRGMVSVAGGKLTTWRRIGVEVAARALDSIGLPAPDRRPSPVAGAADPARVAADLAVAHPGLPEGAAGHLAGLYGALAHEVLEPAREDASLYDAVVAGAPDLRAQVLYAVEYELAQTADDVLRRRTTIALRGLDAAARPVVEPFLPGSWRPELK